MSAVVAAVAEVVAPVVLAFRHERLQVAALHHSAFLAVEVVPVSTSLLEKTGTMQKYFLVLPCWLGNLLSSSGCLLFVPCDLLW